MEDVEDVDEPCETEERGAGFADSPSAGLSRQCHHVPPDSLKHIEDGQEMTRASHDMM